MDFSFSNLNLANVQAAAGVSVLPPGRYACKVTDAKVEATKDGTGRMIVVKLSDEGGKGVITDRLNVFNKSPEATRIGLEQLKSLLVNGGHPDPDNIGAHGVQSIRGLTVGVLVGSEMYQGEARSRVKGYMDPATITGTPAVTHGADGSPTIGSPSMPF